MFYLQLLFLTQCLLGILMLCLLHKTNKIKRQIDTITKEVKEYVTFIEEDMHKDIQEEKNISQKKSKDEAQNRLIQSVLKEYFP